MDIKKTKIAFDVMGNDNGVSSAVNAVNIFVKNNKNFFFYLVGNKKEINKYLVTNRNVKVINAKSKIDQNIGMKKTILDKDTSMAIAINLIKTQKADIIISSGDSGIYLAMSTIQLGRLEKIRRPAFMLVLPTLNSNKKMLMLDVGANLVVTSETLVQWANLAAKYSRYLFDIKKPSVAIINVGHEKYKGQDFHLQAYKILSNDKKINFQGFIEPKKLLNANIDIIVTDGYAGNMIIKTMEGIIESLFFMTKKIIKSKFIYKIGSLIFRNAFKKMNQQIDYRNVGVAWVVGLKNLVIKCHGSADTKSYLGTFNQIEILLKNNIDKIFKGQ